MLLAIDVGNTQTVIGLFKADNILASWRMVTPRFETSDEIASAVYGFLHNSGYDSENIREVAISCVVPRILDELNKMSQKYFNCKPLVVDSTIDSDLVIKYDYPAEIGADRIANAVAAKEIYGFPSIVVDFGTATTFDAISANGEYLGGAIAPGIQISEEALFRKTAKLPRVEIIKPHKAIGRSTVASMQSGLFFGYIGLISNIIKKIKRELGEKVKVVSTGGFAAQISREIKYIDCHEPHLVLEGLRIIHERNR